MPRLNGPEIQKRIDDAIADREARRAAPDERFPSAARDAIDRIMPGSAPPGVQPAQALAEALKIIGGRKKGKLPQEKVDRAQAVVADMLAAPARKITGLHIKRLIRAVRFGVLTPEQADAFVRTGKLSAAPAVGAPAAKARKKRKAG